VLYQAIVFLPLLGAAFAGLLSVRQQHLPAKAAPNNGKNTIA
jgi:hypothetical protein